MCDTGICFFSLCSCISCRASSSSLRDSDRDRSTSDGCVYAIGPGRVRERPSASRASGGKRAGIAYVSDYADNFADAEEGASVWGLVRVDGTCPSLETGQPGPARASDR